MKKNTLILIAGTIVAYLIYKYFIKGKTPSSIALPGSTDGTSIQQTTDTKGTIIVPNTLLNQESTVVSNNEQIIASNNSSGPPYLWMGTKNNYSSSNDACINKASQVEYYVWNTIALNETVYSNPSPNSVYAGDYLKWICVINGNNGQWKAIRVGPTGKILEVIGC